MQQMVVRWKFEMVLICGGFDVSFTSEFVQMLQSRDDLRCQLNLVCGKVRTNHFFMGVVNKSLIFYFFSIQ